MANFGPIPIANPYAAYDAGQQAREQNQLLKLQQQTLRDQAQSTQMDAERKRRLEMLKALGSAAQQADTPEKWAQLVSTYEGVEGPDAVAPYRDFGSRQGVLLTAAQEIAKWSGVQSGVDKNTGSPAFFQVNEQTGDTRPVNGYAPPPKAPLVQVDTGSKGATKEAETVGSYFGETFADLQKKGLAAMGEIANLDRINALLDGVQTGKFKGTTQELKKAAKSFGIDLEQFGITDDTSPVDAATAIINQMALTLRNPESGFGMPGSLSENDLKFLKASAPGLEQTPEGRKQLIDYSKALAKRRIDIAKLARDYRKKVGQIDEGFYDELQKYSDANPLFKEPPKSPSPAQTTNAPANNVSDPLAELKRRAAAGDVEAQNYLNSRGAK